MNIFRQKKQSLTVKSLIISFIVVLLTITGIFVFLWNIDSTKISYIAIEEGPLEVITALLLGISFLLGVFFLINSRRPDKKGPYIPLLLLNLIAFLDEIGYGQVFLDFRTFSVFGIQIDGLHDIILLLRIQMERTPAIFQFIGLLILGLFLVFFICMLFKDIFPSLVKQQENILRLGSISMIVILVFSLIFLLLIPTDSKNVWILGYSLGRTIMVMFFFISVLLSGWFSMKIWRDAVFLKEIGSFVDHIYERPKKWWLSISSLIFLYLVGGFIMMGQYVLSPLSLFYAYAIRLFPFGLWLLLASATNLLVLLLWGEEMPKPLASFLQQIPGFFRRYPAYLFLVIAIIFAVFAQSIDIGQLRFSGAYWFEEIFEFFASITLLFGSLCINVQSSETRLDA